MITRFRTAFAFLVIVALAVLVIAPEFLVTLRLSPGEDPLKLSDAEFVNAVIEERRTVIAVLAALGAGVSLLYTHRRHELEQDRNRTDRFNTAVEHLGDSAAAVQLGGIYALERVGVDSERDAVAVVQILATLVRSTPAPKRIEPEPSTELKKRHNLYPTDSQAALDVLCRHPEWYSPGRPLDLRGANLTNAKLIDANLVRAGLSDADLFRANLTKADLTDADLIYTNLARANLFRSRLPQASLIGADLSRANLIGANLTRADLTKAHLPGAKLAGANLSKADLTQGNLKGAQLRKANLTDAILSQADFTGADFTGANLTYANLTNAKLIDAVLFGADFTRADLTGADFAGAVLDVSQLIDTDFSKALNVPNLDEQDE